jgi:hypothetical protein
VQFHFKQNTEVSSKTFLRRFFSKKCNLSKTENLEGKTTIQSKSQESFQIHFLTRALMNNNVFQYKYFIAICQCNFLQTAVKIGN